jgi:glutamate synthase (NADPH/NADH) small chain
MAAAQQLRREGHRVVLFERDEAAGGLVRFGVPDFKIEKWVVERRVQQLVDEGVELRLGVDVGVDVSADEIREGFDAVVLATGSRTPRDLPSRAASSRASIPRWTTSTGATAGSPTTATRRRSPPRQARRRHRRRRHRRGLRRAVRPRGRGADRPARGAARAARRRPDDKTPWPLWPQKFRLSYAMEEAQALGKGEQDYLVATTRFGGSEDGRVTTLHAARANPEAPFGPPLEGSEFEIKADLVLLAMGFLHPEPKLLDQFGIAKDQRGNAKAGTYETTEPGIFAAGDARRGQSLIVWAINEGRQCARMVERYLGTLDARDSIHSGNVEPADAGPLGPPQGRARYGISTGS